MSKLDRGMRLAFASAALTLVISALSPRADASGQAYDVAVEVMIQDISTQILLVSGFSGSPVSTSNGLSTIDPSGVSYSFSFTAGSVSVTDSGTLTPDGIAPGTGTWAITSSLLTSDSVTVGYNPGTSTYTSASTLDFPTKNVYIPGVGKVDVNDFEFTETFAPVFPFSYHSVAHGYYTSTGTRVGGVYVPMDEYDSKTGTWSNDITGPGSGQLVGDATAGTFTGTANSIPEPSSIALLGFGLALVSALRAFPRMTRS